MKSLGLLGSGGQADETEEYALPERVLFRAVESEFFDPAAPTLVDISTSDPELLHVAVVGAVGAPGLRRRLVTAWAGSEYASVVAASAAVSPSAEVGVGVTIGALSSIGPHAVLGSHVLVNVAASVAHDCALEEYVTLSPGVRVGGRCIIGAGSFLGIGAIVRDGISIASGSVVGAGAVVVDDLVDSGVYVGVPARLVRRQDAWLDVV